MRRAFWQTHETEPKTEASAAPVPVIAPLKKQLAKYAKTHGKTGWMFAGERKGGKFPLNLNNSLRRVIKPALDKAGITWYGWHAFRRGLASNLHELGAADLHIQRIMRHDDVETTRRHYVKQTDEQSKAAMKKFARAFAGK